MSDPSPHKKRSWLPPLLLLIGVAVGREGYLKGEGVVLWAGLVVFSICAILVLREIASLVSRMLRRKPWRPEWVVGLVMVAASVLVGFLLLEVVLGFTAGMPEEWEQRREEIPGAEESYWWHGHLHVQNDDKMRRVEPFPPRRDGVARVVVVGDSLTYGQGIAAEDTYSAVLERDLSATRPVEVLNLGVQGYQSEDVLHTLERFLPELRPDVVVYGVCLNDFLPSGVGQSARAYLFPLPESFKKRMTARTKTGPFLEKRYDDLLMSVGLRTNFIEDILSDFGAYQERFTRDVAAINELVTSAGLPPVVAMVLHQHPKLDSPGHEVARLAEQAFTAAGMHVVPTEDYFREHDGAKLRVSEWDGHPNEEAHRIFAAMLRPPILEHLP
jgi:lysophospholipase L1-like esterase